MQTKKEYQGPPKFSWKIHIMKKLWVDSKIVYAQIDLSFNSSFNEFCEMPL